MLISSYNPNELDDILVIITAPDTDDQITKTADGVARIAAGKDGTLLGYNFMNASKILPELTNENGQVFLDAAQVGKLNIELQKAGFDKPLTADENPKFVAGYVGRLADHPKSDHLKIAQTRIADNETVQIMCGSPNVAGGIKVVVARSGAMMPDGKVIWPGQLMGVGSDRILCDSRELRTRNAPGGKGLFVIPDGWQKIDEPVDFIKTDTFYPES